MTKPLVVVESPAKVRTIKKYLGKAYNVAATVGHIRDIVLKDIHLTGKEGGYFIVLKGFDEQHRIAGVVFDNCTINLRRDA